MRKVFSAIIVMSFLWLIMPIIAKAEDPTKTEFQDYVNQAFGTSFSNTTDNAYNALLSRAQQHPDYPIAICYVNNNYYSIFVGSENTNPGSWSYTVTNGKLNINSGAFINNTYTNISWDGQNMYNVYPYILWDNYAAFQNTFNPIDFGWTNVSYDASVPTPSFDVDLSKNVNEKYFNNPNTPMYGQLGPEIPYYLGVKGSPAYEDYYLYIDLTIWTPTSGELKLENGIYSFTPKALIKTDEIAYFGWEDMQSAPTTSNFYYQTNAPLTGSTLLITQQENLNTWYNIRRYIEDGTNDYPEMSYTTTLTGTAKDNGISRINQMLRNASLAGNRIRFRACLYYINENNELKCGNFATWTSAQPSTPTSEQPSTNAQVIDQPASGISQTVSYDNVVSQNESTSDIPPVNVTTGGANVNVTVNTGEQNVPNNQNYPTVVSYNHDNIFTTFIGTYSNASQYLGGFAAFCNNCLLWIPSEIWSIIGMGFAMALVIMIVKIL